MREEAVNTYTELPMFYFTSKVHSNRSISRGIGTYEDIKDACVKKWPDADFEEVCDINVVVLVEGKAVAMFERLPTITDCTIL